jgi:hypothetical protein
MLLNEFLKVHRKNEEPQATIAELKSSGIEQRDEIAALRAELKEQRALIQKVNDKVELNRPVPQTALNNQQSCRAFIRANQTARPLLEIVRL